MISEEEREAYDELRAVVARLRAPDGCPWDREQTHSSLRPYVIEEAYEVVALLDEGDTARLPEELGDVLFQVLLHSQLAEEAGEFRMSDVLMGLTQKLVRRHPHVFGEVDLDNTDQVIEQWDRLKKKERAETDSALANIPPALPALSYAQTLLRRAESAGFAWPHHDDILEKITEEIAELAEAPDKEAASLELGDILLNVVNYARAVGLDAEESLRQAGHKFRSRFGGVESRARARGIDMQAASRSDLIALWEDVKRTEA